MPSNPLHTNTEFEMPAASSSNYCGLSGYNPGNIEVQSQKYNEYGNEVDKNGILGGIKSKSNISLLSQSIVNGSSPIEAMGGPQMPKPMASNDYKLGNLSKYQVKMPASAHNGSLVNQSFLHKRISNNGGIDESKTTRFLLNYQG